ncbi:uncharacterized protein KY384_000169 [Bacidia gigantensis]|uniref:uncharacterized protein n=1 Tax=Bacidia gigantensis TaxID=2732470 RepID=UPI001D05069E|nr:uncharacterized protein KY384_000169 [Bacidia gigantensis]KAG8526176.1 hypothetical protein KY384_000169 [Bacidia gigantensis]
MPAYHSIFLQDQDVRLIGNFAILPLRTRTRGPAYTLPPLPAGSSELQVDPESESYDSLDEVLSLFRANTFFRNFEIKGPADRLLIYGILFLTECLGKIKASMSKKDAEKALLNTALDQFSIPGDASFPLNQAFEAPRERHDAETLRQYLSQVRQELAMRLLARVYADGPTPSKNNHIRPTAKPRNACSAVGIMSNLLREMYKKQVSLQGGPPRAPETPSPPTSSSASASTGPAASSRPPEREYTDEELAEAEQWYDKFRRENDTGQEEEAEGGAEGQAEPEAGGEGDGEQEKGGGKGEAKGKGMTKADGKAEVGVEKAGGEETRRQEEAKSQGSIGWSSVGRFGKAG